LISNQYRHEQILTVEVHKGVDAFLVRHSEYIPVGVDGKTLQNCNGLRNNPKHSNEGKRSIADSAKSAVD
jgi:hypothetical protein